jgi:hypothetical protein
VQQKGWPSGVNQQYIVMTPRGVREGDRDCAYHSWSDASPTGLVYVYVPYASRGCAGDGQLVSEMETLSHEEEEVQTDPQGGGWWGKLRGSDIAGFNKPNPAVGRVDNSEVSDLCNGDSPGSLATPDGAVPVALSWDKKDGMCSDGTPQLARSKISVSPNPVGGSHNEIVSLQIGTVGGTTTGPLMVNIGVDGDVKGFHLRPSMQCPSVKQTVLRFGPTKMATDEYFTLRCVSHGAVALTGTYDVGTALRPDHAGFSISERLGFPGSQPLADANDQAFVSSRPPQMQRPVWESPFFK